LPFLAFLSFLAFLAFLAFRAFLPFPAFPALGPCCIISPPPEERCNGRPVRQAQALGLPNRAR